jgi:diguanylate cyclase (GGDEF)-like protein
LFIIFGYGLHHVLNEIKLLGYLLLASASVLAISLYCDYKNNFSLLPLRLFSLLVTLAIIVTCYYLGTRGVIFVFPLITSFFYSFQFKAAVTTAIITASLALLAALNVADPTTILRLSIALAINIFFITTIAHLVYTQQKKLLKEAREDPLTGIPNRRCFNELLTQALDEAGTSDTIVALLYMDLNDFKIVNDKYGHCIGDIVLKEASVRLQSCIREDDAVYKLEHNKANEHIARLGGDEFAIILKDIIFINEINEVTNRILKKMNEPYLIDELIIHCHVSLGMAWNKDKNNSAQVLMRQADSAMYQAKKNGKQGYHTSS